MIERATYDLQEYTQTHAYRSHLKTFIINLSHLKEKCRLAYPKKSDVPPIRMLKVLAIPFFWETEVIKVRSAIVQNFPKCLRSLTKVSYI